MKMKFQGLLKNMILESVESWRQSKITEEFEKLRTIRGQVGLDIYRADDRDDPFVPAAELQCSIGRVYAFAV